MDERTLLNEKKYGRIELNQGTIDVWMKVIRAVYGARTDGEHAYLPVAKVREILAPYYPTRNSEELADAIFRLGYGEYHTCGVWYFDVRLFESVEIEQVYNPMCDTYEECFVITTTPNILEGYHGE